MFNQVLVFFLLFFFFFFIFIFFFFYFFFFKQKTAYELVDCDWSSDVCSSDLLSMFETISKMYMYCNPWKLGTPMLVFWYPGNDGKIGRASCRERV
mgnify:CR=1 FL=1